MKKNNNYEFSRMLDLNAIKPSKTKSEEIEALPEELAKIAERLGVTAVESLKAEFKANKVSGGDYYKIDGSLKARVSQPSVVTMDQVKSDITCEFDALFSHENEVFDAEDGAYDIVEDINSPVSGGILDIGELAVQYLSLEIDPYARVEGEEFAIDHVVIEDKDEKAQTYNPFAVLAQLKDKE